MWSHAYARPARLRACARASVVGARGCARARPARGVQQRRSGRCCGSARQCCAERRLRRASHAAALEAHARARRRDRCSGGCGARRRQAARGAGAPRSAQARQPRPAPHTRPRRAQVGLRALGAASLGSAALAGAVVGLFNVCGITSVRLHAATALPRHAPHAPTNAGQGAARRGRGLHPPAAPAAASAAASARASQAAAMSAASDAASEAAPEEALRAAGLAAAAWNSAHARGAAALARLPGGACFVMRALRPWTRLTCLLRRVALSAALAPATLALPASVKALLVSAAHHACMLYR